MFNIIQCAIVLICCRKLFKKKGGEEDVFKAGAECICIRLTERSRLLCQCQRASCLWPGLRGNWPAPYWLTHPHQPLITILINTVNSNPNIWNHSDKKQLHSSVRWGGASARQGQCWIAQAVSLQERELCTFFDEPLSPHFPASPLCNISLYIVYVEPRFSACRIFFFLALPINDPSWDIGGGYENLNGELYFENSINNLPAANNSMGGEWAQIRSGRLYSFQHGASRGGRILLPRYSSGGNTKYIAAPSMTTKTYYISTYTSKRAFEGMCWSVPLYLPQKVKSKREDVVSYWFKINIYMQK